MTRFSRALSHLKSTQIDEKIKVLNKELKKTGVLYEQPANSTANFYYSVEPIPGTPAEMTAVPDPEGILTGEWNQPSNGYDASDPNTWENAFNDWSWLRNPNDVAGETDRPVTVSQTVGNWEGGAAGAGTMLAQVGHGPALGYVSNSGVFKPLVTSSYWATLVPPVDENRGSPLSGKHYSSTIPANKWSAMQGMYSSYESMKGSATTKTIQMWYPWSYFWYGSWESYAGTKKGGDSSRYVLINASIYLDPNEYQTKAAVPAYDLITRDSLDDAKYYPGNPNRFMDFLRGALDVGERAFDWLKDKAEDVFDNEGVVTGKTVKEKINSIKDMVDSVGDFGAGVKDGLGTLNQVNNLLEKLKSEGNIKNGEIVAGAEGSFENPMKNTVSDATAAAILNGVDINSKYMMGNQIQQNTSAAPGVMGGTGSMGAKGIHNNLPGMGVNDDVYPSPFKNSNGDVIIPDAYAFRSSGFRPARYSPTGQDEGNRISSTVVGAWGDVVSALGGDGQAAADQMAFMLDKSVGNVLKTPGKDDPVVHFTTIIPKEQIERIKNQGDQASTSSMDGTNIASNRGSNRGKDYDTNTGEVKGITTDSDFGKRMRDAVYGTGNIKANYEPKGKLISEGWESPKHTYIDKDQQQRWFNADDVAPVYPKDPPPQMINGYHPKLLPKSQHSIPFIKVTKKDLIRSHKLTKDEAQEMIQLVDRLNEFIKNNPDKLAYARERYPKDDVRLAELNFKLDMQLAAADDYIETQFPENKRRLKLIQRAVKKSTQLTDPKTYKKNAKYLPFEDTGILRTVNDLETYGAPTRKKKTRKKNKWIQKPKKKTKQDMMNEKMNQLEIDMKKTLTDA